MAKEESKVDLVKALTSATAEDLETVRKRRAELEKELAGLTAVEKVIMAFLGLVPTKKERMEKVRAGKKVRAARSNSGAEEDGDEDEGEESNTFDESENLRHRRMAVVKYIQANRPCHRDKLIEVTGYGKFGRLNMGTILNCDWFHVNPDGVVSLTEKGSRINLIGAGMGKTG